jgi:hypothetical protein
MPCRCLREQLVNDIREWTHRLDLASAQPDGDRKPFANHCCFLRNGPREGAHDLTAPSFNDADVEIERRDENESCGTLLNIAAESGVSRMNVLGLSHQTR